LIVEPEIDPSVFNLQAVLEGRGAETLAVRAPARAFARTREFGLPSAVVEYHRPPDALHRLIKDLSDIPRVDTIVSALGRLPQPARH
jgi:hypothetical protein